MFNRLNLFPCVKLILLSRVYTCDTQTRLKSNRFNLSVKLRYLFILVANYNSNYFVYVYFVGMQMTEISSKVVYLGSKSMELLIEVK